MSQEELDDDIFGDQNQENNTIDEFIIQTLFGNHSPISPPLSGRVRRREEVSIPPIQKIMRGEDGKRIITARQPFYSYLRLKSGEEFYFSEEDDKKILLNEVAEPNRLIRNIISRVPFRIGERLEYLAKFKLGADEENDEENENDLGNDVLVAYIKEWRLRTIFRRLLIYWRVYKMNKSSEKEVDPITLSEPEKEVHLFDWDNKRKFIFDAKSLATLIESKLLYQEYGFPVPMYPRNPKNNVEFSYKQLVSLYNQLKDYGELRWGFTTLREYNFNKNKWQAYHRSALTMKSIRAGIMLLDNHDSRDLFLDFIFAKMDEVGVRYNTHIYNAYEVAMIRIPNHWYLEKLKSVAMAHFEAEHFSQNITYGLNSKCKKIFNKHLQFINELKSKKII